MKARDKVMSLKLVSAYFLWLVYMMLHCLYTMLKAVSREDKLE